MSETFTGARDFLVRKFLPAVEGRVLSVGVAPYTAKYHKIVPAACEYETIEIRPELAEFGSPGRHHVGDFLEFEGGPYDHIILIGLDPRNMPKNAPDWLVWIEKILIHADVLLKSGGTIFWGGHVGEGWEKVLQMPWLKRYCVGPYLEYGTANRKGLLWWIQKQS